MNDLPSTSRSRRSRISQSQNPAPNLHLFAHGSIVRIKLVDFLTYDSVEFRPGPKLNVIIGPNGTGKSTIVCGICLGLAGKTSVIGRAPHVSDYIKHGLRSAKIEIELCNRDGDNFVIFREIKRDNTSVWKLNDAATSQKAIEELMVKLKIQIGNLCQFLPQDRVADFVKMTQQQLLENTEKAVGTLEMFESHSRLKSMQDKVKTLNVTFQNNNGRLETEIQRNSRLEEDVRNFNERQTHLDKIELLQKKKPWAEYEDVRKLYVEMKSKKTQMGRSLKELVMTTKPSEMKLEDAKSKLNASELRLNNLNKGIRNATSKVNECNSLIEQYGEKIKDAVDELQAKKAIEQQREQKINGLKQQLNSLKNELATLDEDADVEPQMEALTKAIQSETRNQVRQHNEIEAMIAERSQLQQKIKRIDDELQQLQDVKRRRMDMLRNKAKHAYDATLWLQENRNKFRKMIHDPIMTVINVHNPAMAMYVERHISYNDMYAFVCEDADDMNEFLAHIRDEKNLRISAVLAPRKSMDDFQTKFPLTMFREYGFHSYIRELFTAPDAVLSYLCQQYNIHQIPVGNNHTKEIVDRVISETPFNNFYTERHHYTSKKSKYSGNYSTMNSELQSATLLTVTMNLDKMNELELIKKNCMDGLEELEVKLKTKRDEELTLGDRINQMKYQKKELAMKRDRRKNLEIKITQKDESIRRTEEEGVDLKVEDEKTKKYIGRIVDMKLKTLRSLMMKTKEYVELGIEKVETSANICQLMKLVAIAEEEYRQISANLEELERDYENYSEQVNQTKSRARDLLQNARRSSGVKANEELPIALKEVFSRLPDTIQEINSMIHDMQAQADVLLQTDENVVHEYQRRKIEIANLQKTTEEQRLEAEKLQNEINLVKSQWLPDLENLIGRININFSRFFSSLGCAGEVSLKKAGTEEEEFDKYAICIKVKYRDSEQLRELSPFQQSGGERSVATILYMMALQELTKVPFRCVDEINQGMDSTNERKVFELMVQTSCRENTAQYFLLTPKLLPDLDFSNMTVLTIYNSAHSMDHTQWNLNAFLARRQRLQDETVE